MAKKLFGPTALGIDIGDDHIKLALLSQGLTKKVTLFGLLTQPLDPGIVERGSIQNPEAFKQIIVTGLNRFKLNLEDVVASIALPQEKIYLTSLQFPTTSPIPSAGTLAEEHFPIKAKKAEVRSELLHATETHQWVVVSAIDSVNVKDMVEIYDHMGLHVGALEFDSLALVRLLRFDGNWPEFLIILDIGARHATLTALHAESGVFAEYNLNSISGEIITTAISQALSLPQDQAEAFKRMYGVNFTATQKIQVEEAMLPVANALTKELNTVLGFLATHHGSAIPLQIPIIIVGGGAQTLGLTALLKNSLNRELLTWTPGNKFRLIPRMPTEAYSAFAVSIGTALRILQYE